MVKNQPANAVYTGDPDSVPGSGRSPGGENDNHSSILAGQFLGQRGLAGYNSCGRRVRHNWTMEHTHTVQETGLVLTKCKALNSTAKCCDLVKVS